MENNLTIEDMGDPDMIESQGGYLALPMDRIRLARVALNMVSEDTRKSLGEPRMVHDAAAAWTTDDNSDGMLHGAVGDFAMMYEALSDYVATWRQITDFANGIG